MAKDVIFVVIYNIHHDADRLEPGDIKRIPASEVEEWQPEIERRALKQVASMKEAKELAQSIEDGTFVLSPEVSQKEHSIEHGGIGEGKPYKPRKKPWR